MTSSEARGASLYSPLRIPSSIHTAELFYSLPSTNDYLLNLASSLYPLHPYFNKNIVCIAEKQTAGKGRRGRSWISSDQNIYLSLLWQFPCPSHQLCGLSIAVACAVANTVLSLIKDLVQSDLPQSLALKWPNDVFWGTQKLGGILIELTRQTYDANKTSAVIGIGLNVCISPSSGNHITQPYTDLSTILSHRPDNPTIASILLHQLADTLICFQTQGLEPFMAQWHTLDITFGKWLSITTPTATICGIGRGINTEGAFLLELATGELLHFVDGEISLRLHSNF